MFSKIIGTAAIVGSSFFISRSLSDKLKKRRENLHSFHTALIMLENEISFSVNSIDRAFKNISDSVELCGFFSFLVDKIKDNGIRKAWQVAVEEFSETLCLTESDVKILLILSSELGITDKENQLKNINYVLSLLETAEAEAEKSYLSLAGLYRNIGIGAGLAASILLM